MSDDETPSETPSDESSDDAAAETPTEGAALAVPEASAAPAVAAGPAADPRLEQRKSRLWLPFLIPVGAVAVVAFFTLNISRIFLAASEQDANWSVVIGVGITLAILIGATVIAAIPTIRTTSLVVGMTGVALVVLFAGSLVLGASLPKSEANAGYVQPTGAAINTLEVEAYPELKFQATKFDVPAGINLIKYIDKGGVHTLVFDKNAVPGFELQVPTGLSAAKVDLKEGTTYTIYCTIPGHRAAGMEADIVVGPPGAKPEPGTQSPTQTTAPAGGTPTTTQPQGDGASQSSTGGS